MYKTANGSSVARGFVLALLLLGVSGGQALAHRSPSNCNANRLTLSLDQNPAGNIVSGQTVTYTVGVFNPGPGTGIGCDVTGTTVTFTCPGADGTPSGQTTVLGTGLSFPADNSGDTIFPSVSCTIVVTPGVTSATARAQAGQNTGNRTADLTKGVLHDAAVDDPFVRINDLTVSVNTCVAKVDKQVSCDGGKTFHDVGLVSADEDGHTDVCFGWNAFTIGGTSMPAEAIQVRYAVANAGTADLLTCSITEGNAGFPTTVSVGSLAGACVADVDCGNAQATCVNGACVFTSGANSAACSATLSAAEPDKATVTCDCTPTPGEVQATAFDEAKFQCLTPGLAVTKVCKVQAADGTNEVDITLMNTGTADLQNCVVTDKVFPNDPTCPPTTTTSTDVTVAGVASLPAGQSTTVMGSVTGLTTNACNTVSVTCEIKDSVDPANPSQPKKTPPATDQDVCPVASVSISKVCAAQDASGVNQITFTVTNTGGVALANCAITDNIFTGDPTCPPTGAGTPVPTTPATIASLDPGATASATGSVSGLTANACDEVSVTCDVVGATGQTVTGTDEQVCVAAPPPPSGCRVTGGGLVDACGPDLPGGDAPEHCGDRNSDALNATHGGQVGAPVGVATAFTPDSVCIQGEWQHVRHIRPKLYGNFHARTFDSLNCACLPCAGDPGSGTVTDGLCNPGDRICGPEPRRAPDNAICFSGVGDYAVTNGNRAARSVVFRVDVQDHSEPGGTNGPPPPDRYRLRLWFLNGADPTSGDAVSLRMAVACAHAGVEDVGATTPDIDDGGDLIRGNQQIHPSLPGTSRCVP